jgi:hypothetical protein
MILRRRTYLHTLHCQIEYHHSVRTTAFYIRPRITILPFIFCTDAD